MVGNSIRGPSGMPSTRAKLRLLRREPGLSCLTAFESFLLAPAILAILVAWRAPCTTWAWRIWRSSPPLRRAHPGEHLPGVRGRPSAPSSGHSCHAGRCRGRLHPGRGCQRSLTYAALANDLPRELAERLPTECSPCQCAHRAGVWARGQRLDQCRAAALPCPRTHSHQCGFQLAEPGGGGTGTRLRVSHGLADASRCTPAQEDDEEAALASHEELERYFEHLERTLIAIEFHDPAQPRQLMARLRRLYLRARPEKMEMNILRGILSATEKAAQQNTTPR